MSEHQNEHTRVNELLPSYLSGSLDRDQHRAVEQHLNSCDTCQADLALWRTVSNAVVASSQTIIAPWGLPERAMAALPSPANPRRRGLSSAARYIYQLLGSQLRLVHREIWPASALVIAIGYLAALISAESTFIYALAPLVAAACVSLIYGQENDPAIELTLATPTSPRQILLARLVLVFSYNLALVLAAAIGLMPVLNTHPLIGQLLLSWLSQMTFLSAAALALSLWTGPSNAITVSYIIWLAKLLAGPLRSTAAGLPPAMLDAMAAYQSLWQSTTLLLALAGLLFAAAVWLAGRREQGLYHPA